MVRNKLPFEGTRVTRKRAIKRVRNRGDEGWKVNEWNLPGMKARSGARG